MRGKKSGAIGIFLGALLIVVFAVGLVLSRNPSAFIRPDRYDLTVEHFTAFCAEWWLPAGIIGIPLFLISLIVSLIREKKEKQKDD